MQRSRIGPAGFWSFSGLEAPTLVAGFATKEPVATRFGAVGNVGRTPGAGRVGLTETGKALLDGIAKAWAAVDATILAPVGIKTQPLSLLRRSICGTILAAHCLEPPRPRRRQTSRDPSLYQPRLRRTPQKADGHTLRSIRWYGLLVSIRGVILEQSG